MVGDGYFGRVADGDYFDDGVDGDDHVPARSLMAIRSGLVTEHFRRRTTMIRGNWMSLHSSNWFWLECKKIIGDKEIAGLIQI